MIDWESRPTDYENFHKWRVSRYVETRTRYMVTARHSLGYQMQEYCNKGQWFGGTEFVNRLYEDIQCELVLNKTHNLKLTKNQLLAGVYMFEITEYVETGFCENTYTNTGFWRPVKSVLCVKDRVFTSDAKDIKDGYRYNYKETV